MGQDQPISFVFAHRGQRPAAFVPLEGVFGRQPILVIGKNYRMIAIYRLGFDTKVVVEAGWSVSSDPR